MIKAIAFRTGMMWLALAMEHELPEAPFPPLQHERVESASEGKECTHERVWLFPGSHRKYHISDPWFRKYP